MMVREYGRDIGLRIKITNADDDLVVNKTKDHTVMKLDQRRWLMVLLDPGLRLEDHIPVQWQLGSEKSTLI